ncbi:MAG: hypothetical protein ACRDPH_02545 [Marmoricola sp.]
MVLPPCQRHSLLQVSGCPRPAGPERTRRRAVDPDGLFLANHEIPVPA